MSEEQDLATLEGSVKVAEPRTPGEWLRQERQRQGRSVQQIADEMHLGLNMVEAMENDQFSLLGAPVFARGHLRKYAVLLGVPVERVQELYQAVADRPRDADPVPNSHRATDTMLMSPDSKQRRAARVPIKNWSIVGAIVGLVAIGVSGWWVLGRDKLAAPLESGAVTETDAMDAPTDSVSQNLPSTTPSMPAPIAPATTAVTPTVTQAPAVRPAARGKLNLRFVFSQESWVEVYDVHGTRLLYDVGQAGQSRGVEVEAPAQIVLGMAGAVNAEVNGKIVEVPARRIINQVARFTVGADGVAQ
ncbi:MAG TPA: RodZ domain-containing protein [Steroidobacteraceae bacterium]|nr:RodZ domain-containing protein [Steroidobacteraceae bacterium]